MSWLIVMCINHRETTAPNSGVLGDVCCLFRRPDSNWGYTAFAEYSSHFWQMSSKSLEPKSNVLGMSAGRSRNCTARPSLTCHA